MSTLSRTSVPFLRILPVLLLASCSFILPSHEVTNTCDIDGDCDMGTCADHRCVTESIEPMRVMLEVVPTEASDPQPAWRSELFTIDAPTEHDVDLAGWVQVGGQVRYLGERVDAELIFTRPGFDGRPIEVRTSTLNMPMLIDGNESDYLVRLEAGRVYDVEVRPRSTESEAGVPWFRTLPPLRVEGQLETPAPIAGVETVIWRAVFTYDALLDEPCATGRISGCSLSGSVVSMRDDSPVAEVGLQVRAVDLDGRLVSSTALTQEDGVFHIVIQPGVEEYLLRVGGGSDRPLFPIIEADPALLSAELRIRVPVAQVVQYGGSIEDAAGNRVSATVEFSSSDVVDEASGLSGAFRASTTTSEGLFELPLLAGNYEVTVTPADLDLAVSTTAVQIVPPAASPSLQGQLFVVDRRSLLGGSVRVAASEREMPNVGVEARASRRSQFEQRSRSSEAVTDETGQFALPLDVGAYDLYLRPPAQSGFAWMVAPGLVIGGVDSTLVARYQLEPPVPLAGVVRGADGQPVNGMEVRAFAQVGDRFVEVGRGRVENGTYEILLPPRFVAP